MSMLVIPIFVPTDQAQNRTKYVVSTVALITAVHWYSHPTVHDSSRIFQTSSEVYTVIFAHIYQKTRMNHTACGMILMVQVSSVTVQLSRTDPDSHVV